MNWNFEQIFAYKKCPIECCFVEDLVIVFASRDGRVFVYEMVEKTLGQVFDLSGCEEEFRQG
jgi:hypothetical protein